MFQGSPYINELVYTRELDALKFIVVQITNGNSFNLFTFKKRKKEINKNKIKFV